METIKFENVSKNYGDNCILSNFNMSIEKGEFVTIIGSSGSGKTTVLKSINGLIPIDSGHIFVDGKDIAKIDQIELRRHIGYVIQGSVLFPHMNIERNIAYVPSLDKGFDKHSSRELVLKWIHLFDLNEDMLSRYPDELSGGQQQRVGLARALAASPKILIMDEPFSAVDEITRRSLQKEIKRLWKDLGLTIVFVTHDIDEALNLGSKVIVMRNGIIEQYDTPKQITNNPATSYVSELVKKNSDKEIDY